jgi:hypothetical protein
MGFKLKLVLVRWPPPDKLKLELQRQSEGELWRQKRRISKELLHKQA